MRQIHAWCRKILVTLAVCGKGENDPQRLCISLETVIQMVWRAPSNGVKFFLRDMAEWRVPYIVQKSSGVDYIRVEAAGLLNARHVAGFVQEILHEPSSYLGNFK
jgi:hypothetical protein